MSGNGESLVDAAVSRMNGESYTLSFTAEKKLFPLEDLDATATLQVLAWAGTEVWIKEARSVWSKTWDLMVVVMKQSDDTNAELGPLMQTVEDIKGDISAQKLDGKHCAELIHDRPYDLDQFNSDGVFISIVTFRFKGF